MIPNKKTARLAGLLWIITGVFGGFSQLFVRGKLIVSGDMAATANNIVSNEFLLRLGFVSDQMMMLCTLFTSIVLYKLLSTVNKNWATLMVILAALGSSIGMLNYLNEFAPLQLLSGAEYLNVIETSQLQAQVMLYFNLYEHGYVIAQFFYVLWVFPLGLLVYKSGFLPRVFGILFMLETFTGFPSTLIYFLFPNSTIENILMIPGALAELSFMFWLLIRGINESKVKADCAYHR